VSGEHLRALPSSRVGALSSDLENLAIDYAIGMGPSGRSIPFYTGIPPQRPTTVILDQTPPLGDAVAAAPTPPSAGTASGRLTCGRCWAGPA